ncbi:TPA: hyaluronidase HylP [Streptococcus pyogenes]|nr:hyaluronidase HylP [Streptococcus pyogenes]HES1681221.1 hyaluronidase HylP [Streptococcus pyogenes]HES4045108.1 hyaluronidase HylP [Streptococcus pyogenes]
MAENIPLRVQFKRMSADEWARSDVILLESEIGFETDTGFARAGDGHNRFSDLGYISPLDYNLLTNKPNIDGLATKVETAQKLQQKADKETVYTKAESKQELDKKLNLKGGVMTGQLKFKPAATVAYSSSTGGAVNIDLSSSRGAGVVVYSNNDTSDGPLMSLRTGKETFNQSALNITSGNENGSAMQIRGSEEALGTLKITHENPSIKANYDKNAAALSIDIVKKTNGAGTAAQGIYINSTSGTTGKLLRIRNLGDDKFYVKPDGGFYAKKTSQIDGNLKLKNPTADDHAATKKYVDEKIAELKKLIQKTD